MVGEERRKVAGLGGAPIGGDGELVWPCLEPYDQLANFDLPVRVYDRLHRGEQKKEKGERCCWPEAGPQTWDGLPGAVRSWGAERDA